MDLPVASLETKTRIVLAGEVSVGEGLRTVDRAMEGRVSRGSKTALAVVDP